MINVKVLRIKFYSKFPTLSRGISLSSLPCFKKTFPADCEGLIPIPSKMSCFTIMINGLISKQNNFCLPLVMIAEVAGGTLNCSAANLSTAVKGVSSGTFKLKFTNRPVEKKE